MNLLIKLEEFKQLGMSNVRLDYGEEYGELDLNTDMWARWVTVQAAPNGYHHKVKVVFVGRVTDFLGFNFRARLPEVITNYPLDECDQMQMQRGGWFIFGEKPEDVAAVLEQYGKQPITG